MTLTSPWSDWLRLLSSGQKRRLATVIDSSAAAFTTMFVSGGQRGLEIELAPDDLVRLTDATLAEIARW